jgi:putative flippase GtrA
MLKKQIIVFIILGILTVIIDYIVYNSLLYTLRDKEISDLYIDIFSKALGFLSGTIFAYFANKYITFKNQKYYGKTLFKFITLYIMTLLINVLVNSSTINILYLINIESNSVIKIDVNDIYLFAFLAATGFSATLNFIGMKWFVFYNIENNNK